jgi:hypothetical protein
MVFPLFVVRPANLSRFDVFVLPLLSPPADQDHKFVSILAEINAVTGGEVDLVFKDSCANAFDIGPVPSLNPRKGNRHFGCRNLVQLIEPLREAFPSRVVNVSTKLKH